ncbi:Mitochondrial cardiolipin hydrolase [Globisporangium polare]
MGNCIGHDSTKNTRDSVEVVVLQSPLNARGSKGRAASAKTKAKNGGNGGDSFVDVLFFPDPGMPCKNFRSAKGCTRKNCKMIHDEGSSLLTFLEWLNKAKKTMEVCVFTITCDEIADTVLALHAKGVVVRVITDDGMAKGQGSDIQKFIDAGIQVRDDNARTYMHNKFCVIDSKILLNGSFNWSRQAVVGNQENLVINVGGPIIGRFRAQFEKLWKQYDR